MKLPSLFKNVIIGLGFAIAGAVVHAAPVLVLNHSFEFPDCATPNNCSDGSYSIGTIANWTTTGISGVFDPTDEAAQIAPTDGDQVAFSNRGSISQTLTSLLTANTTYMLEIDVGDRADANFPGYLIELLAGGNTIATNLLSVDPVNGSWTTIVLTYTATAGDLDLNTALGIRLTSEGEQTLFDNVRLDATAVPEPFTTALLGLGLLSLAVVRRRSMKK